MIDVATLLPHNADIGREEAKTGSKDIAGCFFPPTKSHPSIMFQNHSNGVKNWYDHTQL